MQFLGCIFRQTLNTHKPRIQPLIAVASLIIVYLFPGEAYAQARWLQNIQVLVPLEEWTVSRPLVDTLVAALRENSVGVKRSPEDGTPRPFRELESSLLDQGLDYTSANSVFISYRFEADNRGFRSDVVDMYFIYRPHDLEDADIPILYIDATERVVQRALRENGMVLATNEAVFQPFWDQIMFHRLPESTITMVGGRVIRSEVEAETEKRRLMATIRQFVY